MCVLEKHSGESLGNFMCQCLEVEFLEILGFGWLIDGIGTVIGE